MINNRWLFLTVIITACLFVPISGVSALTITDLYTGELVGGQWVIMNDAAVTGGSTNWQILVGTDSWFTDSGDYQYSEWHAVGMVLEENGSGYQVDFDYDLYTWDTYDYGEEEGDIWWDNFGVNLNSGGLLWDLELEDPDTTYGGDWPGVMWSWGGSSGYEGLEHNMGSAYIIGSGEDIYLTVFLSTGLVPDADYEVPSWGSFNPGSENPVPEPSTLIMLGFGLAGMGRIYRGRKISFKKK